MTILSRYLVVVFTCAPLTGPTVAEDAALPANARRIVSKFNSDVQKARAAYLEAIEQAQQKAITGLAASEKRIVQSGNLEAAVAVKERAEEIKTVTVRILFNTDLDKPISHLLSPTIAVTVPAKSKGQPIGQFKVGQKIAIQYVSGEWAFGGPKRTSLFSPDNKPSNVELVSPSGNTHGLPAGTKQKPFMYSVVENGVHKLRMADVLHSDNRGEVVYSISLVK